MTHDFSLFDPRLALMLLLAVRGEGGVTVQQVSEPSIADLLVRAIRLRLSMARLRPPCLM
jgi:hypothetical protein